MMQHRDRVPEKPGWLRRSAYRRHGAAPDRKMPCSMRPLPGKGVLSNQKCTLNTPRVHPRAPSRQEVPQQQLLPWLAVLRVGWNV